MGRVGEVEVLTFDPYPDILQAPLLQQGFGHVTVLNVLEESVQFCAVHNWMTGKIPKLQDSDTQVILFFQYFGFDKD